MVFLSICTALYDYTPQDDNELAIRQGELIYILEKSAGDDWWKAKKRAPGEAEEPVGLIPYNYVEEVSKQLFSSAHAIEKRKILWGMQERQSINAGHLPLAWSNIFTQAQPIQHAKALYEYTRQTEEELSFSDDSTLLVYDTTDPDWTLVGLNGEYGFAPANYIELIDDVVDKEAGRSSPISVPSPRLHPTVIEVDQPSGLDSRTASSSGPAAALAGIMYKRASAKPPGRSRSPPPNITLPPRRPQYTPEESEDEPPSPPAPSLPQRPPSQSLSPGAPQYASQRYPESPGLAASPPYNRAVGNYNEDVSRSPSGGFHLYNINEMVSALGKKKKMPTTLGLNLATGNIMIAPEKSRDGPQQEWTAEKLTHYSIEGKHVFMELVRPSKSIDFHAGAKDTAQEIVASLGEIAGAARAEGLREVLAAGTGSGGGQKRGHVLYDFMAQGEDEVTVAVGDEVIVLDDMKSNEWWMIRRLKNGNEGVVPSSYIEKISMPTPPDSTGLKAAKSVVEQNRLEEERLAKESVRLSKTASGDKRGSEVGPGVMLPKRGSSLMGAQDGNQASSQRSKKESKGHGRSGSSSKSSTKPHRSEGHCWLMIS